jgi:hypothetical protein
MRSGIIHWKTSGSDWYRPASHSHALAGGWKAAFFRPIHIISDWLHTLFARAGICSF